MSDETNTAYDPFDDASNASNAAPADDGIDWSTVGDGEGDPFDDLLDGVDFEETETDAAIQVRDDRQTYSNPYDVGLKAKMWVPVQISMMSVEDKHIPRLSSKSCVAKLNGKDGSVKKFVLFDQVESALRSGGEEVIGEIPLPYFVGEANHVAPQFGHRRFPYEIDVPVFTIKTALFKPRNGRTGYKNDSGRTLRVATGALEAGETVNQGNMHEVAGHMEQKIVMAQVSISQSKKPRRRNILDAEGDTISVLLDPETGDAVKVFKGEAQDGQQAPCFVEGSNEAWTGNEALLHPIDDRLFAVRDSGESSGPLQEEFLPINDYINPPFLPVPERKVEVERLDDTTVAGEITWDTVGVIARAKTPGDVVDVLLRTGEIITATWLGTEWVERPDETDNAEGGMDEFSGDKALASL